MELIDAGLRPDLILADVMMPEMDGYALLNKIRQNDWANHTHFIMLSARASEEDRIFGLRAGVDDYVVKPFSSDSLLALVNARIDRNQRSYGYP
jgi:DNA-binding response OmpR family regulator